MMEVLVLCIAVFVACVFTFLYDQIKAVPHCLGLDIVCATLCVICLLTGVSIFCNNGVVALQGPVTIDYGTVRSVSGSSIEINDTNYKYNKDVNTLCCIDYSTFKVGDIVRYEHVDTSLKGYLVKVEKINPVVVEKEQQ